jgi:hypothetical protein
MTNNYSFFKSKLGISLALGGALITGLGYYLYKLSESEVVERKEPTPTEAIDKLSLLTKMTEAQKKNFKNFLKSDLQITYEGELLSEHSLKRITHRAVLLGLDKLIDLRDGVMQERRKNFENFKLFVEKTLYLFREYFNVLQYSLKVILELLDIPEENFEKSQSILEATGRIRKSFIRDVAWHLISETKSKREPIPREQFIDYLNYQIDELSEQLKLNKNEYKELPLHTRIIVLNGRVDDQSFFELGIDDVDYVHNLRFYVKDKEVNDLINKRNKVVEQLAAELN